MSRKVTGVVTAHQQREGAGFLIRRALPTHGIDLVDPFLMLDEVGPVDYGPGEAIGAPDHPHRGFETVSYILEGEKLHEDSTGKTQLIGPGEVQWMTAGSGIVHSELPSARIRENGGRAHGFQIWVNLPARDKLAAPGYQHLPADGIPKAVSEDGRIEVTVIAGEALGARASIGTRTPVWLQDWRVQPGGHVRLEIDPGFNAAAYVFDGAVLLGEERQRVERSQLAVFGSGDAIEIAGAEAEGGRFLLLAGQPLQEPVARYGPFVMNTEAEITTAVRDYQSGRMGEIVRS